MKTPTGGIYMFIFFNCNWYDASAKIANIFFIVQDEDRDEDLESAFKLWADKEPVVLVGKSLIIIELSIAILIKDNKILGQAWTDDEMMSFH